MLEKNIKNALMKGNVVVVAGAGISKDVPANLPSWWEYNILLLEMIGKLGAESLNRRDNLLEMNVIQKAVPVVSVSDFFVNRIAGKSYFPLLEMLDGAAPNEHHLMLAKWAKKGCIRGIVTTNFDTLIEKAFQQCNVLYNEYSTDDSYQKQHISETFPIYKIHGSAEKALLAIDTAQQKLQGLSAEKKYVLQKIFSENHLLFMGFSGEDFLFGSDYIPVRANKGNNLGITWLAHPGSSFNKQTQKLIDELQINVLNTTLQDFYKMLGWDVPKSYYDANCSIPFRQIASKKIRALLESPHIGKWACTGMCIELLDLLKQKEQSEKVMIAVRKVLGETEQISFFEGVARMSLYSALSKHSLLQNRPNEAFRFLEMQMRIFKMEDDIIKINVKQESNAAYCERMLNRSTVLNRIGELKLKCDNAYLEARKIFCQVFWLAYKAMHWENISVSLCNIALCDFEKWRKHDEFKLQLENNFVAIMESAVRTAKRSGHAQNIFETSVDIAAFYAIFGQRELFNKAVENAEDVYELCLDKMGNYIKLEDLKKNYQNFEENQAWPRKHMILCASFDDTNAWAPFSERPILKYEEGRNAKRLFDMGKQEESINYMGEKINCFIEDGQLDEADAFSNCLAGIFMDLSNKLREFGYIEAGDRYIKEGKKYYEQCLEVEFKLGRFDYLVGTLGSLSKLNSFEMSQDMLQRGLFQAELCLCICDDPIDCWQVVLAAEAACNINVKMGKRAAAREYCEKYCNMTQQAPWSAAHENIVRMRDMLKRLL